MASPTDTVRIFDTTLRDGEQSPGIALSAPEKIEIARQLDRLGVDVIEAGFAISSPGEREGIRAVAQAVDCVVASLARTNDEDVDAAIESLQGARNPRIHVFIATSDIHMEHKLRMTPSAGDRGGRPGGAQGRRRFCSDVEFSCEDATRTDADFMAEVVRVAIAAGATTINIPDTVGYTRARGVHRDPERPARARARGRRRRALGALPQRPGPGRRQLARGRRRRRAPGRVHDQRHRRAGRQRLARGDRDAPEDARAPLRACRRTSAPRRSRARRGWCRA